MTSPAGRIVEARPPAVLANLQALRAAAAIAVVIFHFGLLPATGMPFTLGAAGVDVFFVLSGFIIAYSSARDPRHFLARRVIRVVPAYWIATMTAALFTLQALPWREAAGWLGQSLFYLPGPGGRPALIFVAWTLVYELAFYLLYRLALCARPRFAPVVALVLLAAVATVRLPGLPGPWPLFLEFALGIVIYLTTEHRFLAGRRLAGPLLVGAGLVLLATASRLTGYDPGDDRGLARVVGWGLPAGCIVLGAVVAERSGLAVRSRLVLLLGAASYAIYLLHPIAVGQLLQFPATPPPLRRAACLAATAALVAVAVGFHRAIEAPLLRRLRRLIGDRPPVEQRSRA